MEHLGSMAHNKGNNTTTGPKTLDALHVPHQDIIYDVCQSQKGKII